MAQYSQINEHVTHISKMKDKNLTIILGGVKAERGVGDLEFLWFLELSQLSIQLDMYQVILQIEKCIFFFLNKKCGGLNLG